MKRTIRRLMFWLLVLLFAVTTPTAILYSQGFRFDFYKKIFIHSGSITIKALPANPKIYVNGLLHPSSNLDIINSSVTIGGLRPGNYDVKVAVAGHADWQKQIAVHSGVSTEFWNVVLPPQNPQLTEEASQNVSRFFPSPFGKNIAFIDSNPDKFILSITNIQSNTSSVLYSDEKIRLTDDLKENLEWNFKEDTVLCPIVRNSRADFFIMATPENSKPVFLSDIAHFDLLEKARWSPQEKGVIYFLGKNKDEPMPSLYRINIDSQKIDKVLDNIATYDLSKNAVYFVQDNHILYKSNLDGQNVTQLTSTALTDDPISAKSRLIVYDDDRQVLLTENGNLFVRNNGAEDTIKRMDSNVQGSQFSDDGKKLLYWTDNEIKVLFLRKWEVQPYRDENEIQSIIRLSVPIDNVFWYKDYEHVFYSSASAIKIAEIDPRDHRINSDVFSNNLESFHATYDAARGIYYFLRDSGDGNRKIFFFNLPEKTGFFG